MQWYGQFTREKEEKGGSFGEKMKKIKGEKGAKKGRK